MMRVVHLGDPVGDGELQLMRPQPAGVVAWGEADAGLDVILIDQRLIGHEPELPAHLLPAHQRKESA